MLITTDQIIADARSDLYDRADVDDAGAARDTLWSDADLLRYLNSACARWASDTLLLRRRFTVPVVAGVALLRFPLDEILDLLQCSFMPLGFSSARRLESFDIHHGVYREDYGILSIVSPNLETLGQPSHYTRDYDNVSLRLYPVPAVDGTFAADAITLPGVLFEGMPLPFTTFQDRDLVLMWMKKLAYEKQDADTLDLTRAQNFESEYKTAVKDRRSEIDRIRRDGGILHARF